MANEEEEEGELIDTVIQFAVNKASSPEELYRSSMTLTFKEGEGLAAVVGLMVFIQRGGLKYLEELLVEAGDKLALENKDIRELRKTLKSMSETSLTEFNEQAHQILGGDDQ